MSLNPAVVVSLIATGVYLLLLSNGSAQSEQTRAAGIVSTAASWEPTLAQLPPVPVLAQQGNQIMLNGRLVPATWSARQQRIGIEDAALTQVLGVTLLSNQDLRQQPVQWFSDPAVQSLVLGTWLTNQSRFLDVTDLARALGWKLQMDGGVLQVATAPARVLAVRQGRQSWGDRIVLDLDQPAPWQLKEDAQAFSITIDGSIDPTVVQSFAGLPGNLVSGISVEANGSQTILRVALSQRLRPRISTLPNANRLVIDIRSDSMIERDILWAPGIRWRQQYVSVAAGRFPVVMLLVDPRQSGLQIKPIQTNPATAVGTSPLITMAQRAQAVAAINAGFFNRNNVLPLGAIRRDNRWISGPILGRGAIAWNPAGEVLMGRLGFQGRVTTSSGQQFPLFALNSGYVGAGVSLYTADWGAAYTPILDNETIITVQNNRVLRQQTAATQGQGSFAVPADGYLLVARANAALAPAVPVGSNVQYQLASVPNEFDRYPNILGAGPLLVQNSQIVLNARAEGFSDAFIREAAPRSAIGKRPEGTLMLVAIHNRVGGAGPTLSDVAQVMQQLGAVDALNFDGGSSTSLYLGGQLLNRSPRTAARVHNGMGIFIQPGF